MFGVNNKDSTLISLISDIFMVNPERTLHVFQEFLVLIFTI